MQLTKPAQTATMFKGTGSLSPSLPMRVTNIKSNVVEKFRFPVVTSTLYEAIVTQWILQRKRKNRKDLDVRKMECIYDMSVFIPTLSVFPSDVWIPPQDLAYKPPGCPTYFADLPMR